VTRYPLAFSQISGGSGRVAGIVDGSVRTFDARSGDQSRFDVSAPVGTLIDTAETAQVIDVASKLGLRAFVAGYIENGDKKVVIRPKNLEYAGETLAVR
jgi:hypothetical protein